VEVVARIVTLELAETFVIARESQDTAEVVQVEVRDGEQVGYGEAAPIDRYDQTARSALAFLQDHAGEPIDETLARTEEPAARSALDAALHDLRARAAGEPAWRVLGLPRTGPPTSWTIWLGDPDDMARRAEATAREGLFRRLKLKLGARDGQDVERVRAVRAVTPLPLQVDVNEYWTLDEALDALPELQALGVQYCEQPLPEGDPDGAVLKRRSPLPIYVDEDCHTLADVEHCAEIAHGITIKLAKSGGVTEAHRMANKARELGLGVMLGCMIESGLGIAAGCLVAPLCDHVDLDGNLLLRHDPWPGVQLVDGVQTPSDEPGLGVHPAKSAAHFPRG
jgi:L-alanine-DL-glutamate epimerase-like enolase superfamily enzyme